MRTLDRYIARRFLENFIVLLSLLFVFAISIDFILQLDEFVEAVDEKIGPDGGFVKRMITLAGFVLDFHGPRIFQFYAYMVGLLTVGAMGFTFAQMHRARELTAVLAAGVRLHRVAAPILLVAVGLNLVQLANQEFILPKLASRLIRTHGSLGRRSVEAFSIPFTADGEGNLLHAPSFDPNAAVLLSPTILERDDAGRTVRRIMADRATWNADGGEWVLEGGRAMVPERATDEEALSSLVTSSIDSYATDLSPRVLTMRRYRQFATMLSMAQIREMTRTPGVIDDDALGRYYYGRFATILINLLLLCLSLPFFLLREPANLLRKSMWSAVVSIPAMMGALIGFAVDLPGIPAAVGVFLPSLILTPIALFMVGLVKT